MELKQLQADPAVFRAHLLIDADGTPKRLGDVMELWQQKDFEAMDPAWLQVVGYDVQPQFQRYYAERPRGASKSSDCACSAAYAVFASRRKLTGIAAAASRDQARLLRDAIERLTRLNPWLGRILDVTNYRVANKRTGSTLDIISSDANTAYGLTPHFVIVDELTHWSKEDLWISLFSAIAKRRDALLCVISNAGYGVGESWQWRVREAARTSDDWYFHRLARPASWISEKHLEEQRKLLPPLAYRRLWLNEWTSGSGDALAETGIDAAVTLPGPLAEAEPGWMYVAGLDLGLARDAAALVVVGRHIGHSVERPQVPRVLTSIEQALIETGNLDEPYDAPEYDTYPGTARLRVARVDVWKPKQLAGGRVDIEAIEEAIATLHSKFRLASVGCDPWQAAYLIERLRKRGVMIEGVNPQPSELKSMCSAVLEAFNGRTIELYDDPNLVHDLRNLRVVERVYGLRLDSPRTPDGHGDAATSLALALHILRNSAASIATNIDPGYRLICH